ncbi:hypothetical protein AURDEDRAFT_160291 [Auricularia subglabra TFB-10046 SS5]|nr:hypothetical protein AURDEDRAFT_160291 [Auricularia subglabra TFB-10046 SS5]
MLSATVVPETLGNDGFQVSHVTSPAPPFEEYYLSTGFMVHLAAACWLLCDYVDTIQDEITYVWNRRMSLGSALFFAMRYIGAVCLCVSFAITIWPRQTISQLYCDNVSVRVHIHTLDDDMDMLSYRLIPVFQFLIFWLVEVVMQMRIYALYQSRPLAVANGVLFFAEIAAMILMWQWSPITIGASGDEWDLIAVQPPYAATYLEAYPQVSLIYWTPGIALELWLAALAVGKMQRKVLKRDLLRSLVNDSLRYFLMMAILVELHVVLSFYQHGSYAVPFVIVGETVGGSRLVLHLRKAYYGRWEHGTGETLPAVSFAFLKGESAPPEPEYSRFTVRAGRMIDESFYDAGEDPYSVNESECLCVS